MLLLHTVVPDYRNNFFGTLFIQDVNIDDDATNLQPVGKWVVRPHHLLQVPFFRFLDHDYGAIQLDQYHDVMVATV